MHKKLYQAVFDGIIERIVGGEYGPGTMLPNEFDIAANFGVSQGTARKALIELEKKRIVERRQGKGTFVTLRTPENSLFHFFRLRDKSGAQVVPDLSFEDVKRRPATAKERDILSGSPEHVFEVRRLRSFDGTPLGLETSIVSCALFPGLLERAPLPNTLYVLFQQAYACAIISVQDSLSAGLAGDEAGVLGITPTTPVLMAERQAFDLLERVVEIRHSVFRTDKVNYTVALN